MDDNLDRASDPLVMGLTQALQHRKPEGPKATGECLWCGETTASKEHRWCDSDCRDHWEIHVAPKLPKHRS